jgi:mycothiol synthase
MFMRRPNLADLPEPPPLPVGYALRRAGADDVDGIAATMASAFGPDWTADRVREALLDAPDVPETYVVTFGDTVVATASVRLMPDVYPGSGYLHWVGAHAEHRGQRIGTIVSLAVLRQFREIGCRDAVLETDPFRLPAIRTYLRLGFVPEPVEPEEEELWSRVLAELGNAT